MHKDASEVSHRDDSEPEVPHSPISPKIVISALPGIVLVWSELWIMVALVVWSAGSFMMLGILGEIIVGIILLGPAIWASWQVWVWAIIAEQEIAALPK